METPLVSDIAFSNSVKAAQTARGSRGLYENSKWRSDITPDIAAFIAERTSFYLATASAEGQPISSIAADPKVSCAFSMRIRSPLPISPATGNTSRPAISMRTRAPIFF